MSRMPPTRLPLWAAGTTLLLSLAACGAGGYAQTPLSPTPTAAATTSAAPTTAAPTPAASKCNPVPAGFNPLQTYDPLPSLPASGALTGRLAEIRARGYLIAGVSADTLLMGARNPLTGQIEGFDIDLVHEIAKAILGDAAKVQLVVITAGQRQSFLVNRTVDIVVRNMTMNCARWLDWPIAFSAEYYHSGQKVLVRKGSTATSLDDLAAAKAKVCAPTGTTSLAKLQEFVAKGVVPVTADTHTGCLLHFQQAKVDAITGDDTVLAGLATQDPYAVVPAQTAITAEPYGVGFNSEDKVFVQYVNRLLETTKADGRWKASYDRWLAPSLGDAPTPPAAVYGRQ
ncbi:MAG TPA: glutamate ABC transporter substrate-binding protein [Dermatophilaceae bacterium]|jgi:polar amino acid transport system substrate-binding protein|nr:glutamate ABC transporter substrate-binding protein [Dermatophilaceae bacterium]HNV14076.1 glutamate ABC transporter substrate-binding protein [Dermatophilaceae bacterium]HOA02107.1 glutamate ABC transporter substrate-binding protein [Dermatophilaceae bacterium]HOV00017.1 glutamate ABC transporter substrate-binding protein [Dermatophilaceae bacterium]HPV78722.1 glutamate ABC transporter substrate-binding protein [Dermatophilaceae bacterium]